MLKKITSFLLKQKSKAMIPQTPPQVERPSDEIYTLMGQENIYKMLEDFYNLLGQSSIKEMFPQDLVSASQKSAAFFVGLCGGPPLFHQLYGNPRLRARHLPFPIDEAAKDEWLACFDQILEVAPEKYNFPPQHIDGFREFLHGFSPWMINR